MSKFGFSIWIFYVKIIRIFLIFFIIIILDWEKKLFYNFSYLILFIEPYFSHHTPQFKKTSIFPLNLVNFRQKFALFCIPKMILHNRSHAKGYMYRQTANAQMFIYYIRGGSKPKYQMLSVCKNKINALTFAQRLMAKTFKVLVIKSCDGGLFKVQLF